MTLVVAMVYIVSMVPDMCMPLDIPVFPPVDMPPVMSVIARVQVGALMPYIAVVRMITGVLVVPAMFVVADMLVFLYMIMGDVVMFVPPYVAMVL